MQGFSLAAVVNKMSIFLMHHKLTALRTSFLLVLFAQEDFLDLTVAVKGVAGLEEALWNMYVEEEYFENDNLYRCGACDKLVEASKVTPWGVMMQG